MSRLGGGLAGAAGGALLAALEAALGYLPALASTDLGPEPGYAVLAGGMGALAGGVLGALHPAAAVVGLALAPALTGGEGVGLLLGLVAGAAAWALSRRPTLAALALAACGLSTALLPQPTPAAGGEGDPRRPDLLLVVLDTVSAPATSLHGAPLPTTPALEALGEGGVVFGEARSAAPWTVPSHAAMFTGLSPRQSGCHHEHLPLPPEPTTLAERLGQAGYRTGAFVANAWVSEATGLTRGFDHVVGSWQMSRLVNSFTLLRALPKRPTKSGGVLVEALLEWLEDSGDRPSFAFLNVLEAHAPYHEVPEAGRFGVEEPEVVGRRSWMVQARGPDAAPGYPAPGELEDARALYGAAIRGADEVLQGLLMGLEEAGRGEDSALMVTSDHGEAFGEHGYHGHLVGVYREVVHVPLVLRLPGGVEAGVRVDAPVSNHAAHNTLLELAGLTPTPEAAPSLLPLLEGAEAPVVFSAHQRPEKLFDDFGGGQGGPLDRRQLRAERGGEVLVMTEALPGGERSLQLFLSAEDRQELRPLPETRASPALRQALEAHLAVPLRVGEGQLALDEALVKELEALGYLGGS